MITKSNRIAIFILAGAFAATTLGLPVMAQSNASSHQAVVEQSENAIKTPHKVKIQQDHGHASHDIEREEDRFHAEATDHNRQKRENSFDGEGK